MLPFMQSKYIFGGGINVIRKEKDQTIEVPQSWSEWAKKETDACALTAPPTEERDRSDEGRYGT